MEVRHKNIIVMIIRRTFGVAETLVRLRSYVFSFMIENAKAIAPSQIVNVNVLVVFYKLAPNSKEH